MRKQKRGKKRLSDLRVKFEDEIAKAKLLLPEFPHVSKESIRRAVHQIETMSSPELIILHLENARAEALASACITNRIFQDSAA